MACGTRAGGGVAGGRIGSGAWPETGSARWDY